MWIGPERSARENVRSYLSQSAWMHYCESLLFLGVNRFTLNSHVTRYLNIGGKDYHNTYIYSEIRS